MKIRTCAGAFITLLFILSTFTWKERAHSAGNEKMYRIKHEGAPVPGRWLRNISLEYSWEGKSAAVPLQIYFPAGYSKTSDTKTLVALHGYSESQRDWGNETGIEGIAASYKIAIVCPGMGKTIYETKYYRETEIKWGPMPGGRFIGEVLMHALRDEFGLAMRREKTGIIGVSIGGRGSMLAASLYKDYFCVAAGLSGYYDILSMTKEKPLVSVYGDPVDFKERWETDDNLMNLTANLMNTNIFLFHGVNDYSVPKEQSLVYAMRLGQEKKKNNSSITIRYREKKHMSHDWKAWNRILAEAMEFIDKAMAR